MAPLFSCHTHLWTWARPNDREGHRDRDDRDGRHRGQRVEEVCGISGTTKHSGAEPEPARLATLPGRFKPRAVAPVAILDPAWRRTSFGARTGVLRGDGPDVRPHLPLEAFVLVENIPPQLSTYTRVPSSTSLTTAGVTAYPRPTTWSWLERASGTPFRVNPPFGKAPPPKWASIAPKAVPVVTRAVSPVRPLVSEARPQKAPAPVATAQPSRTHDEPGRHVAGRDASVRATVTEAMPADWTFGELELTDPVRTAVWMAGYREPTPIQAKCVPILLAGNDVVGQAQTGTGKTAAFGLPIIERIDPSLRSVQALILVPTRELCRQVTGELTRLGRERNIEVLAVYGGEGMDRQLKGLAGGAQVVVGTPGRVQDHLWRNTLVLTDLRVAVLDEADEMLDIGFAEAIEQIIKWMPRERQTCLFSATVPPFVARLVKRYLRDPEWVSTLETTGNMRSVPSQIRQNFVNVAERDKLDALDKLVKEESDYDRVLVFRRMKITSDRLAESMQRRGYVAKALHGDLPQGERNRVLDDFRSGRIRFLIATNVAARGLDIDGVSHVLNYDLPDTPEEYVHRIGRTGRAGRAGTAISFVSEWDYEVFGAIKDRAGDGLVERDLGLYGTPAEPTPASNA